MGSHSQTMGLTYILALMMVISLVSTDLAKDREECATQLVGLATCLPYVGGTAKAPTPDCCSGLKQVLNKSKKCLCFLIKDRNDPALGLNINATLALTLPTTCNTPANVSDCPALLHLAPNSTDAQIFEQFANSTKGSSTVATVKGNSSSSNNAASAAQGNHGGRRKRWLGVEMVRGVSFWCLISLLIMGV